MKSSNQVDIPLLFFSLGFFIIIFGLLSKYTFQKKGVSNTNVSQITQVDITPKLKLPSISYSKPFVCNYSSKEATVSASIQNNSVEVRFQNSLTNTRYVVEGDCLYSWTVGEKLGKKQCGVGRYIGIVRQMLSSGLASPESINSMIKQAGKSSPVDSVKLLESCKNVIRVDKSIFVLPKSVVFK